MLPKVLYQAIGETTTEVAVAGFGPQFCIPPFTKSRLVSLLLNVDKNSTPGYPLKKWAPTNGQLLYSNGFLRADRIDMLHEMVLQRVAQLHHGPASDPIYVFVKMEPHKKSKIDEGRFRLISGVSLIDNLVARHVFGELFERFVEHWSDTPVKVGWNPFSGGQAHLWRVSKPYAMIDRSSWDWTFKEWEVDGVFEVLNRLMGGELPVWVRNHFVSVFKHSIFYLGRDEIELKQIGGGMMKSGYYLTILVNSIAQVLVHKVACINLGVALPVPFCIGDDTLQPAAGILNPDGTYVDLGDGKSYCGELESLGHILKPEFDFNWIEFAGFKVNGYKVVPSYSKKHGFLVYHVDEELEAETLVSYARLYSLADETLAKKFLQRVWEKDPRQYRDFQTVKEWALGYN